jgi:hypothetical protein
LDGTVVAVPFDARRLEVTGPPSNALDEVVVKGGGATELAVSSSGTMAYVEGVVQQQLVFVDRAGMAQPVLPSQSASCIPGSHQRETGSRSRSPAR